MYLSTFPLGATSPNIFVKALEKEVSCMSYDKAEYSVGVISKIFKRYLQTTEALEYADFSPCIRRIFDDTDTQLPNTGLVFSRC